MKKTIIKLHNFTGTVMSIVFLIWFLSGFVLIFTGFPHSSRAKKFKHLKPLTYAEVKSIDSVPQVAKSKVELEKLEETAVFRIYKGRKSQKIYNATTLQQYNDFTANDAIRIVENYMQSSVKNIQKNTELDMWMPWSYYSTVLPIYECEMDDEKNSVVYLSSKTGTIVQNTNTKSRWLAYVGAIPHWVYFKNIRKQKGLWVNIVTWLAAFGVFVSISGIFVGFFRLKKRRKNKRERRKITPYKKFWYKWHHITGFIFGLFVFTFILSGLISVTDVPGWLVSKNPQASKIRKWNQKLNIKAHTYKPVDVWNALEEKTNVRKFAWKTVMNTPYCHVYYNDHTHPQVYVYKQDSIYRVARHSESEIMRWAKKIFPDEKLELELITEYNYDYKKSAMRNLILPVYRVNVANDYNTQVYVNPETGEKVRVVDNNSTARRWLFRGLHKFDFPIFNKYDWLRKLLLILASIAGTIISLTGCVLGVKWVSKKRKRRKRRRETGNRKR